MVFDTSGALTDTGELPGCDEAKQNLSISNHGEVEVRAANIDGVFSASKISDSAGLVLAANVVGQIGNESFDWSSLDVHGADVRAAGLRGQILGDDGFDWSKVDPAGEILLKPNLPSNIDVNAFDGVDLKGADVRKPNCDGVIGDAAFVKLVTEQVTPLTPVQSAWRLAILPLALAVPAALAKPLMGVAPTDYGPPIAGLVLALVGIVAVMTVVKKILMVKQGQLCFAQFFENGATHVLQAGVQLVASFLMKVFFTYFSNQILTSSLSSLCVASAVACTTFRGRGIKFLGWPTTLRPG